jgi:hypothetical protein
MASSGQLSFADPEGRPLALPSESNRRARTERSPGRAPPRSTELSPGEVDTTSHPLQLALDFTAPPAPLRIPDARLNLTEWQAIMQAPMRNKRYRLTSAASAVVDYLTWKEIEDGAAPRTLDQYERDLSRLCLAHPAVPAERLTADQYRSVIAAFPAGSRKRATAVFRDFSRWLYQEGRSDEDAMGRVRYPRAKRQSVIDVFSDSECARLVRQPDRDRPLVRLLLEAGLRKAEARRLQLRHLDVEQSRLRIIEGKGRKDRLIPLPPALLEEILTLAVHESLGPGDHLWYATKANQFGEACLHRERPIGEQRSRAGGAPAASAPASPTAAPTSAATPSPPAGYGTADASRPSPEHSGTSRSGRPTTSMRTSPPRTSRPTSPAFSPQGNDASGINPLREHPLAAAQRRGPDSNRCTRLCRPLPNHSATAP